MDDLLEEFDREDLQELLEEQFDPERFYKALSNALAQLASLGEEAA